MTGPDGKGMLRKILSGDPQFVCHHEQRLLKLTKRCPVAVRNRPIYFFGNTFQYWHGGTVAVEILKL